MVRSAEIQSLLSKLRRRVRAYVWIEGISLALVWLGLTFWLTYAIDYWLLVRVFAVEFPWYLRAVLLAVIAGGLLFVLYRWILRRAFASLADHSMAVVLERRFSEFQDSLVTSVELDEHPDHAADFSRQMLDHTAMDAEARVPSVRLSDVFNFAPIVCSVLLALLMLVSIGSFALGSEAFSLALRRTYLLADEQWPRKAQIEIVGISVRRSETAVAPEQLPTLLRFDQGPVKVARGSDVTLRVRANAGKVIPDRCVVRYWAEDGGKGTVEMEKVGDPQDGFQSYRIDRPPFKGVASSFRFEVIGKNYGTLSSREGDEPPEISLGLWPVSNREEGYVQVVKSPVVAEARVSYVRPKYVEPSEVPTEVAYGRGIEIPRGSKIQLRMRSNNPLKFVHIRNPNYVPAVDLQSAVSQLRESVGSSRHARWFADHYLKLAEELERDQSIGDVQLARQVAVGSRPRYDTIDLWKQYKLTPRIDSAISKSLDGRPESGDEAIKRLAHTYRAIAWAILGEEVLEVTETLAIKSPPREVFEYQPPRLDRDLRLEVSLHDEDDIVSESPYRIAIAALPDEAPKVNVYLSGIGTAVTPDVVIPLKGTIRDDYGVEYFRAALPAAVGPQLLFLPVAFEAGWVEMRVPGLDPRLFAFDLQDGHRVDMKLDFRALRNDEADGFTLEPGEESKLFIDIRAEDRLDIDGPPNVGKGDMYQLDVVTPDKLLIMLERQEAAQRERLQQIRNEMAEAYDFLLRVRAFNDRPDDNEPREPADTEPGDAEVTRQEQHSVRFSYAVRALLQTRKSSQEVAGVIDTILDIRQQLINNRIDAEDHKRRLQEDIAEPLQTLIAEVDEPQSAQPGTFPAAEAELVELERRLKVLTKDLDDIQLGLDADAATAASIEQVEQLLTAMDQVLQKLRKIEDYNKLIAYVRELLEAQKELNEQTRQRYKKSALEDLLD